MKRAALILAGGKARRFQDKQKKWLDKALAKLSGKPLLVHVVENAHVVADEVVVCVNDEDRKKKYARLLEKHNLNDVGFAVDEKISHINGPNVAIMTGLKSARADFCVTLPCDMPLIKPKIIQYLFDVANDVQVAVPMWPNGRLETLVMVLERNSAAEITETLCRLRHPRSDDIIRGASNALFVSPLGEMKRLDPELKSFVNINHHEDLHKLQTQPTHGSIKENFKTTLGALLVPELQQLRKASELFHERKFEEASDIYSSCATTLEKHDSRFWGGISREKEGETLLAWSQLQQDQAIIEKLDFRGKDAFWAAATNFGSEAEMHAEGRCRFLAERAWADKAWCESWVMGKTGHVDRYPPKH